MSSNDLSSIRRNLSMVSSMIKKEQLLPAANSLHAAVKAFIHVPMMKAEQEEFIRLIEDACFVLQSNKKLRAIFPLEIKYVPQQERQLLEILEELIAILDAEAANNAQLGLDAFKLKQQQIMQQGKREIENGEYDAARKTFAQASSDFPEDGEMHSEIGESFLQAGLYDDAEGYLNTASNLLGASAHVLNHLGICLRKMKRFDKAEEKFREAIALEPKDPNLYFNFGRMFLDAKKWEQSAENAQKALDLDPSFTQASQMVAYCHRMISQS